MNIGDFMQVLGGRNPQQEAMQMLNGIAGQNPMAKNMLNMIQNNDFNGANTMLNNMAKERGIDINQIRNMMQHR